jgi:hypothetical protein
MVLMGCHPLPNLDGWDALCARTMHSTEARERWAHVRVAARGRKLGRYIRIESNC